MNNNEIKIDPNNYRKHSELNRALINKSLKTGGPTRSIAMDNDNVIIAGNGVFEEAQKLGIPYRIIESEGKELIIIKRTDLSTGDEKRKLLAMADNRTSDTSQFDFDLLAEDFGIDELCNEWNFDSLEFEGFSGNIDEFFEKSVNTDKKPHLCPHCGKDINEKPL
jgi:hypothetical protein